MAPELEELTDAEFFTLMENVTALPEFRHELYLIVKQREEHGLETLDDFNAALSDLRETVADTKSAVSSKQKRARMPSVQIISGSLSD